jgi:hypothetical protein
MSRDATGIYSAWATQALTCPVCRAGKGERCDLERPGYAEHGTHWERTEEAPPYPPPDPTRSLAINLVFMQRGTALANTLLTEAEEELVEVFREKLKAFAARALEEADAPLRAMQAAVADAVRRQRIEFDRRYGSFWKCLGAGSERGCGAYFGPRAPGDDPAPRYCPNCDLDGAVRAHGYTPPPYLVHAPSCDMGEDCACPVADIVHRDVKP